MILVVLTGFVLVAVGCVIVSKRFAVYNDKVRVRQGIAPQGRTVAVVGVFAICIGGVFLFAAMRSWLS